MTTFILRSPEHAHKLVSFLKENAGEQARIGQPLVVTVEAYQAKRSGEQNRRLWALLTDIAEQAVIDGKRFSKEAWFEHFKSEFAPKQEGPRGLVAMSTTQMTKQQFADFMTRVEVAAVQTLGVEFLEV
ncbi:recombination protein NinB [Paraburkholderia strydomiana]|uniref:recombination protein NinB n=1 Tax=Paraburkholderia strydomiana TaxID=1245417 RepID=UPI0038BCC9ED